MAAPIGLIRPTVIADAKGAQGIGAPRGRAFQLHPGYGQCVPRSRTLRSDLHRGNGTELGINSDARYRFERGVDPAFVVDGAELASRLILDLCGGVASELVIAGRPPEWRRS